MSLRAYLNSDFGIWGTQMWVADYTDLHHGLKISQLLQGRFRMWIQIVSGSKADAVDYLSLEWHSRESVEYIKRW
jgi:hypothetical protein